MHISFDLDSTLLKINPNTDDLMIELIASALKIAEDQVRDSMNFFQENPYSISGHIKFLKIISEEDANSLAADIIVRLTQHFKDSVYPDTFDNLERLRKGNFISVVTYGGVDYQFAKLKHSGILALIDDYRIVQSRFSKYQAINEINLSRGFRDEDTIFVDDKEKELDGIRSFSSEIKLIRIDRSENLASSGYQIINSLDKILEL